MVGNTGTAAVRRDLEAHFQTVLDDAVASLPADVPAEAVRLAGSPADALADYSEAIDLLVTGSRGYGPLHAVLAGGVAGRLVRLAQCPLIVVPRGVEFPLA